MKYIIAEIYRLAYEWSVDPIWIDDVLVVAACAVSHFLGGVL